MVSKKRETEIYQLKVTLVGLRPPIWRRILVKADTTLAGLHDVLQVAMGWTDSHLHQYVADGDYYGVPDPAFFDEVEDERKVRLNQILLGPRDRLTYEYDFGDSWTHQILLEKILPPEPGARYPKIVAGKRACPPEDVGGIFGYAEFLDAIQDPSHPEHEEYMDWTGDGFDPEAFDLEEANRQLARVK
jgi:hypothetical protein